MKLGARGQIVADIQRRLEAFGYLDSSDDIDEIFGERTDRAVRAFQRNLGLKVDGEVGPITLRALALGRPTPGEVPIMPPPRGPLEAAQATALAEAVRLWALDIYDPKVDDRTAHAEHSRREIDRMLRAGGRADLVPYRGDGHTQWCGYFLAKCYAEAGVAPAWLATYFGSTWRLWAYGTYHDFDERHRNPKPATGPYRLAGSVAMEYPLPFIPRGGDILIVGNGDPKEGDHITIVESYDAELEVFRTISGNGGGIGPDGKRREGVVRATYHVERGVGGYHAMWLYRPAPSDLRAP